MSAKRFSEFTKIPLGQVMQVVGLVGKENTLSEGQVYLLSKPEIDEVKDNTAGNSEEIVRLKERVTELEGGETGGPTMADIQALQQKDVEHENAISGLQQKDISLDSDIEALQHEDTVLDAAITSTQAALVIVSDEQHQQGLKITALESTVETLNQSDTQQDFDIEWLKTAEENASNKINALELDMTAVKDKNTSQDAAIAAIGKIPTRKKSEVSYSGLNITLNAGTSYNLINRLKANTPASGALAPFFNVTSDKMNVFDDDTSVLFKLNVTGSWSGSSTSNKSMQIDFEGPTANRQTKSRDEAVTSDVISIPTFFSIDKGGFLVSNGSAITIRSNGSNFNITAVTLIAEQVTTLTDISAH